MGLTVVADVLTKAVCSSLSFAATHHHCPCCWQPSLSSSAVVHHMGVSISCWLPRFLHFLPQFTNTLRMAQLDCPLASAALLVLLTWTRQSAAASEGCRHWLNYVRCPCSVHLVNYMFDQTRYAAHQFTNYTAFEELSNIWSITQRTCNRVRVTVKVRTRVRASFRVSVRFRLVQLAKCTPRLVKHTDWPNAPYIHVVGIL